MQLTAASMYVSLQRSSLRRNQNALVAAGVLFCAFPHVAHADIKIVTQVDVSGLPDSSTPTPSYPQTVTTYYKDTQARTDISGGLTTLYNKADDTVTTLDPEKKTYYVTSLKKREEQQSSLSGRMSDRMQVDSKLDLKLADAPNTETVTDLSAKKYDLTGSITISRKEEGLGSGGMGGGGGFPGGGGMGRHHGGGRSGGGGGGMRMGTRAPKTEIDGEVWLSDTIKLPSSKKFTSLPTAESMVYSGDLIVKSLSEKINKQDELPLYSKITLTRYEPPTETSQDGLYHATQTVITTTKVTSVSQVTLDPTVFQVPSDYQKIEPPTEE